MQSRSRMEGQAASRAPTPPCPARSQTFEQAHHGHKAHLQPYQAAFNAADYEDVRQAPLSASVQSSAASPCALACTFTQPDSSFRDGLRGFGGVYASDENGYQQTQHHHDAPSAHREGLHQYKEPQHNWVPAPTTSSSGFAADGHISPPPEFSLRRLRGISPLWGCQNEHTSDEASFVSEASLGHGTGLAGPDLLPADRHTRGVDRERDQAHLPDFSSDGQHVPGQYLHGESSSFMSTKASDDLQQGFICQLCGKTFTAKNSLRRHKRQQWVTPLSHVETITDRRQSHNELPALGFYCQICDRSFSRSDTWEQRRHNEKHEDPSSPLYLPRMEERRRNRR